MITAYSQLLIRGYGKEQQTDSALYIDFIREGTRRMQELLKDLLTYTQMGSQPWNRSIETIDLNSVLMEAIDDCRHSIEETEARVTRDHLPRVSGDERHFGQLFANLITNALKYRAECPPLVHISATNDRNMWRLGVADNGIGIAPEHHESIFRPFKRLHGKDIPGTGVGLAICRRVVEQYGARIWVESDIGQGSTFYFTLPAVQVSAAHD
jgi:light-regulated signal transduction histidine kinase (bacteriophytochrome)